MPEGRYDLSTPAGAPTAVLALHPHPDMGGDRHNPVVDAVFRAAVAEGWAVVRFDFSSSAMDVAVAEAEAALDLLPAELPVAVVGYSFGAVVAAHVVDPRVSAWVLVAPPFAHVPGAGAPVGGDPRPKLVLVPARDQFSPPVTIRTETAGWATCEVEEVAGADHFMAGATTATAARAIAFLRP